jgi:hypothetical protein
MRRSCTHMSSLIIVCSIELFVTIQGKLSLKNYIKHRFGYNCAKVILLVISFSHTLLLQHLQWYITSKYKSHFYLTEESHSFIVTNAVSVLILGNFLLITNYSSFTNTVILFNRLFFMHSNALTTSSIGNLWQKN